jgi:large subunit ribosomal protein L25
MKTVSLSGSLRENVGKKDAKKHRREGLVPCVMYGGKEQVHFYAGDKPFRKLVFTPEVFIFKLNIGGNEHNTIVQDIQFHPVTDKILHVDFLEVPDNKPVVISVPVKFSGVSPGVLKGGKLITKMRKLKIKALMQHLPDNIVVDISSLEIGDSARVTDVKRDNITFLDGPNNVIVGVRTARTVVEEAPAAEAAAEAVAEGGEKKEGEKKEGEKK